MTDAAPALIRAPNLLLEGITHGFFTRQGGVSTGVYASLNGGIGSKDAPQAVAENRRRMSVALGVAPVHLLVPYQVHSPDAIAVSEPWPHEARPHCDGIATATPGLALGVTGADCGMVLFADAGARVIGAAHAGWKGALTGVLEATLAKMESLGARRNTISCALGPMIGQASYEVGPEFVARFLAAGADNARFFAASGQAGHALFDLPGFIAARLQAAGVGNFENLALDTYSDPERFYSYRRTTHLKQADYGRLVGAIALA